MSNFTLNAWRQGPGQFCLIGLDADWLLFRSGGERKGWIAVNLGVLGFRVCATYWPGGK